MPYTSSYRLAYRLHSREQAAATGHWHGRAPCSSARGAESVVGMLPNPNPNPNAKWSLVSLPLLQSPAGTRSLTTVVAGDVTRTNPRFPPS